MSFLFLPASHEEDPLDSSSSSSSSSTSRDSLFESSSSSPSPRPPRPPPLSSSPSIPAWRQKPQNHRRRVSNSQILPRRSFSNEITPSPSPSPWFNLKIFQPRSPRGRLFILVASLSIFFSFSIPFLVHFQTTSDTTTSWPSSSKSIKGMKGRVDLPEHGGRTGQMFRRTWDGDRDNSDSSPPNPPLSPPSSPVSQTTAKSSRKKLSDFRADLRRRSLVGGSAGAPRSSYFGSKGYGQIAFDAATGERIDDERLDVGLGRGGGKGGREVWISTPFGLMHVGGGGGNGGNGWGRNGGGWNANANTKVQQDNVMTTIQAGDEKIGDVEEEEEEHNATTIKTPYGLLRGARYPITTLPSAPDDMNDTSSTFVQESSSTSPLEVSRFTLRYATIPSRWSEPELVKPWNGDDNGEVLDATQPFGPECAQISLTGEISGEEDCLFMTIYSPFTKKKNNNNNANSSSPTDDEPIPTAIWIHGGSFHVGSSHKLDGSRLAATTGMNIVVPHYRLGLLGWMAFDGGDDDDDNDDEEGRRRKVKANHGLKDVMAAVSFINTLLPSLKSSELTLIGHSSGASIVRALLLLPAHSDVDNDEKEQKRRLSSSFPFAPDFSFARAILQSDPQNFPEQRAGTALKLGRAIIHESTECSRRSKVDDKDNELPDDHHQISPSSSTSSSSSFDIDCLQSLSLQQLLTIQSSWIVGSMTGQIQSRFKVPRPEPFGTVVDFDLIRETFVEAIQGLEEEEDDNNKEEVGEGKEGVGTEEEEEERGNRRGGEKGRKLSNYPGLRKNLLMTVVKDEVAPAIGMTLSEPNQPLMVLMGFAMDFLGLERAQTLLGSGSYKVPLEEKGNGDDGSDGGDDEDDDAVRKALVRIGTDFIWRCSTFHSAFQAVGKRISDDDGAHDDRNEEAEEEEPKSKSETSSSSSSSTTISSSRSSTITGRTKRTRRTNSPTIYLAEFDVGISHDPNNVFCQDKICHEDDIGLLFDDPSASFIESSSTSTIPNNNNTSSSSSSSRLLTQRQLRAMYEVSKRWKSFASTGDPNPTTTNPISSDSSNHPLFKTEWKPLRRKTTTTTKGTTTTTTKDGLEGLESLHNVLHIGGPLNDETSMQVEAEQCKKLWGDKILFDSQIW